MEYKTETTFFIKNRHGETVTTLDTSPVGAHIPVLSAVIDSKLSSYDLMTLEMPADVADVEKIEEEQTIIFEDVIGWREYIIKEVEDVDSDSAVRTLFAELSSAELLDEVLDREIGTNSRNPEVILADVLKDTRWEVGHVDSSIYSQAFNDEVQYKTVLEVIDLISSKFSAEVQFSYAVDYDGITRRYVNLYKQFGRNIGKRFEVGKDVTEISRTVDTSDIKTAIIPYSPLKEETVGEEAVEERLTIESVEWRKSNGDPTDKPLGQNYLEDPEAKQAFGRFHNGGYRNRFLTIEMDVETEEELIRMAWVQLGRYTKPKVTYEMKAVDLWALTGDRDLEHERVALGDSVVVIDDNFAKPITVETRVVELKRDLLDPANNELVLGESRTYFKARDTEDRVEELSDRLISSRVELVNRIRGAGGNDNYYGSDEPSSPDLNDIWFRPHPEKPNETQMLRFNGSMWIMIADTSDTTKNAEAIAEQQEDIDDAKESADKANQEINDAINAAGFSTLADLTADIQSISTRADANALAARDSALSASTTAESAMTLATDLSGQVSDFELTVDGFTQTVNNYEDQVAQFTSDVNGLNSTVASYETQVDEFGNTVGTYATQVSTLTNTVSGLNSTVSSYQSDVQGYQSQVSTLTNTVNGFNATVQRVEGDYSDLSGAVQGLGASIGVVEGQITNKVWQTDIQSAVDGIEVGGRNLFSAREYATQYPSIYGESEGALVIVGTDGTSNSSWEIADLEASTNYVLHFSEDINDRFAIPSNNIRWDGNRVVYFKTTEGEDLKLRGKFYPYNTSYPRKVFVKLEKGNKATDWTPAPEDTLQLISNVETEWKQTAQGFEQSITRVETGLDGKASLTAFNTLTSTVNGTVTRVGNAEGKITTIETNVSGLQTTVASKASQTQVTQLANGFNVLSQNVIQNLVARPRFEDGLTGWAMGDAVTSTSATGPGRTFHNGIARNSVHSHSRIWVPGLQAVQGNTYTIKITYNGDTNISGYIYVGNIGSSTEQAAKLPVNGATVQTRTVTFTSYGAGVLSIFFTQVGNYRIREFLVYEGGGASSGQLAVLNDQINLRVKEGDVMSQINIEAGRTLIQSNKLYLDSSSVVFSGKAFIPNAAITSLTADKITTGTLNAANLNVINLSTSDIVGLNSEFVRTRWNDAVGGNVSIDAGGIGSTQTSGGANHYMALRGGQIYTESTTQGGSTPYTSALFGQGELNITSHVGVGTNISVNGSRIGFRHGTTEGTMRFNGTNFVLDNNLGMNGNHINSVDWIRIIGQEGDTMDTAIFNSPNHPGSIIADSRQITIGLGTRESVSRIASFSGNIQFMRNLFMNGNTIANASAVTFDGSTTMLTTNTVSTLLGGALIDRRAITIGLRSNTTDGAHDPVAEFYGQIHFYRNLYMNGRNVIDTSDARKKNGIVNTEQDSLQMIRDLTYRNFYWNDSEISSDEQFGLIAQEADPSLTLYNEAKDEYGINQNRLIHTIGHAVQQLSKEHENTLLVASHAYILAEQHEDELEGLRKEVNELKEEIEELRGMDAQ